VPIGAAAGEPFGSPQGYGEGNTREFHMNGIIYLVGLVVVVLFVLSVLGLR